VNKIVFLDIKGVLQGTESRRIGDLEPMRQDHAKLVEPGCMQICGYDAAADWDKLAVRILKKLLADEQAQFVLTSSREIGSEDKIRHLLRIHGLDSRFIGMTRKSVWADERSQLIRAYWGGIVSCRECEILSFLMDNQDIKHFVVLSSRPARQKLLAPYSIQTKGPLNEDDYMMCSDVLSKRWPDASRKSHFARFMEMAGDQVAYA
jgi:hypothetical protein